MWVIVMRVLVTVDERGRITIPSEIRKKLGIKKGSLLELTIDDDEIRVRLVKSVAEECFGKYKVKKWPKDLDEFVMEAIKKWWSESTST